MGNTSTPWKEKNDADTAPSGRPFRPAITLGTPVRDLTRRDSLEDSYVETRQNNAAPRLRAITIRILRRHRTT
jgi:hypothetical protein